MLALAARSVTRGFCIPACSHITDFDASAKVREWRNDPGKVLTYIADMDRPPHYLREWRKFRRMTQDELAAHLDTSKSVISDMERDHLQLSPKWAHRIAPLLGTTAGHLIDTDPNALDSDIIDIWTRIADVDREQAAKVLRSFVRTGTDG